MRYKLFFLFLLTLALSACIKSNEKSKDRDFYSEKPEKPNSTCNNQKIVNASKQHKSDLQVEGCGAVIKVLPDDLKGSKHQKMIVKLSDIQPKKTILIAHNIDLAPRVKNLQEGDEINFFGEYEYNSKGGVVHWTHHDPAGQHEDGWIRKDGMKYD